jgi:hypothetical protein
MLSTLQRSSNRDKLSTIDFKRDKIGIPGKVVGIKYDHYHSVPLALIRYADAEERYILAPSGLKVGDVIKSEDGVELKPGNALPLKSIPVGTLIHNIELQIGKGGQLVRTAGGSAQVVSKEDKYALIRLPSGKLRHIPGECLATIGQVAPASVQKTKSGKTYRHKYWREGSKVAAQPQGVIPPRATPVVSIEESVKGAECPTITEPTPVMAPASLLTLKLTVSPPSGRPGTTFKVNVTGATPNHQVTLLYKEYCLTSGWHFRNKRLKTDSQGKASVDLKWKFKDDYIVWVVDEATGGYYSVTTSMIVSPVVTTGEPTWAKQGASSIK